MQRPRTFIKKNWLLVTLTVLFVAFQFVAPIVSAMEYGKYIFVVVNVALIALNGYLVVFGKKSNHKTAFIHMLIYAVQLFVIAVGLFFILRPKTADWFAKEDFIIENMTALAVLIGAVVLIGVMTLLLWKRKVLEAVAAVVLALAFFVVGMEEISWGQRIFEIESSEFFVENNMQKEINLHNLDTDLSMTVFFLTVFVMFTVIPFWKKQSENLLKKLKLSQLSLFIPSRWLILILAASVGFITVSYTQVQGWIILIGTVLVLIAALTRKVDGLSEYKGAIILTLGAIFFSHLIYSFFQYQQIGIRPWAPPEYRELIICFGLMLYAIDVWMRSKATKRFTR